MCRSLLDWICCCCCLPNRTRSGDADTYSRRLLKKYGKGGKTSTTGRYGTNWESLIHQVQMSPSQIDDSMMTKDITIDIEKCETDEDIYKEALKKNYELDTQLGVGSYGVVFKIKERTTGELRAVKISEIHDFNIFKNEVFCLRLLSHKNVVKLLDHFIASNLLMSFLIMEFAEKGDLFGKLEAVREQTGKGFPEEEAKRYFVQIANAINFVHLNGVIHGDLKLDNVLIFQNEDNKEIVKVSDFGCARVAFKQDEGVIKARKAGGTIVYMAPEQLRVYVTVNLKRPDLLKRPTKSYNPFRADVWGLGVCLYRMLFYAQPFIFDQDNEIESIVKMLAKMKIKHVWPKEIAKDLSKECLDLLTDLLEYNKNARIDIKIVMKHKWIFDSPDLDRDRIAVIKNYPKSECVTGCPKIIWINQDPFRKSS